MANYRVLSPVKLSGGYHGEGEAVDLDEAEAGELLKLRVVEQVDPVDLVAASDPVNSAKAKK